MRISLLLSIAVLGALAVAAPAARAESLTPVAATYSSEPWAFKGSDDRFHLAWEMQITNVTPFTLDVTRLAVRDGNGRKPRIASWSGKRVGDVLVDVVGREPKRRLEPGQTAYVFLHVSRPTQASVPSKVVTELSMTNVKAPRGAPPRFTQFVGAVDVNRRAPARLGSPLKGDRWLAADGCCTAPRHVRALQSIDGSLWNAQRYAIDFERLDTSGRLWRGDDKVLTNWEGYGEEILAVADATVVKVVDGLPNAIPGSLPPGITAETADGNAVFLRLRDGRFVMYAHMIPGSPRVRVGQRVRKSQTIGLVGNSGNSSAPHMHIHVVDRLAILATRSVPYTFDKFTVTGKVRSTEDFNKAELTGIPVVLGPVKTGTFTNALSMDQSIVSWG